MNVYRVALPNGNEFSFKSSKVLSAVIVSRNVSDKVDWMVSSKHGTIESANAKLAYNANLPAICHPENWENVLVVL